MNQLVMTSGGYSVGNIAAKVEFNKNPVTQRIEKKLDKTAHRLYTAMQRGSHFKPVFPKLFTSVAFNVVLKPHAMKHTERYRGAIAHWKNRGLI